MVYFDLESLFINVPIEDAVQAALRKLGNDSDLANHTNLTPTKIADLLNFVLRSTYFQYNGQIYEQQDGAAMGSPVSAVIANIYMEHEHDLGDENSEQADRARQAPDSSKFLGLLYRLPKGGTGG